MNLYLIERGVNADPASWEDWIGAVVVAESQDDARRIHPNDDPDIPENWWENYDDYDEYHSWIAPEDVQVTDIGIANVLIKKGVVFNSNVGTA